MDSVFIDKSATDSPIDGQGGSSPYSQSGYVQAEREAKDGSQNFSLSDRKKALCITETRKAM